MTNNLRLGLHAELDKLQQSRAASIYADERNWGWIIQTDFHAEGYYPTSPDETNKILLMDAWMRDQLFPAGQLVLMGKEEEEWNVLGSIHTLLSNKKIITESFDLPDSWNVFTGFRHPSTAKYDPEGDRWACYAIQTDQSLDKTKWNIKPADLIIHGVKTLAFGTEKDYDSLASRVEISVELKKVIGTYPTVKHINPLTRISGLAKARQKYPELTAENYAQMLVTQVSTDFVPSSDMENAICDISKFCSLRYHLSRGAQLEQVVPQFRIHDISSLGYGASVLYSP